MQSIRSSTILSRSLLAAACLAVLVAAQSRAQEALSDTIILDGSPMVPPSLFEADNPKVAGEAEEQAILFDQSALPSDYETCYRETLPAQRLTLLRPYDGASFPRNIAPPLFQWQDTENDLWRLSIRPAGQNEPLHVITRRTSWRPDARTWEAIKSAKTGEWIDLEVRGLKRTSGGDAEVWMDSSRFRVSTYPADRLIVYRMVTPLFHGYKTPDIHYRFIDSFDADQFLPGEQTYCTNCHSFPVSPDIPSEDIDLAIAVRDQLVPETQRRILGLYNMGSRSAKTLNINSFFMTWDPEGTRVAVTGGYRVSVRPLITLETQEFYVLTADILIVDSETLEVFPLTGASTPENMESFPTWSPDGKTIVFARAEEISMEEGFAERRYNLYKVPYNDGKGGEATPIPGASHNEMSNFAPRFSPDGKWLVFNKCDWSSLVAPSSDLWIMSTEDGAEPRPLECNVPYAMDSHHSWSSNGRWLLFASKRDDGIFARIYLTEIDEDGHASPPVELPCKDDTMMCFNVPEFLRYDGPISGSDILARTSFLKE